MPIVEFSGHITPTTDLLISAHSDGITFRNNNFHMVMRYVIDKSVAHIKCELEILNDFTLDYAHTIAFYQVRAVVDALAFSKGIGLRFILDSCTLPDEQPRPLQNKSPHLATLCTLTAQEIVDLTDKERRIQKPLNDLAETLMFPLESYVNCGRAIDGICRLVSSEADRKKRWKSFRENLNLGEPYVRMISDLSIEPRHGATEPVHMPTVSEVRVRSWIILNRFFEFRKSGNVPLREPKFPLL